MKFIVSSFSDETVLFARQCRHYHCHQQVQQQVEQQVEQQVQQQVQQQVLSLVPKSRRVAP